jgi:hypothetical protein
MKVIFRIEDYPYCSSLSDPHFELKISEGIVAEMLKEVINLCHMSEAS